MAVDWIKPDELTKTLKDAEKMALPLHEPFSEWERIARNRPHPGIAEGLPKVTDGTLASIVQEKPKRIVQQIPTGTIESTDKWLKLVGGYILQNVIIPNANEEAMLIQKCWAMISKGMIYGSQPVFSRFINRGEYFGTDFTLPYVKDVLLEPGKVSDRASNVMFLRTWWTKNQIRVLMDQQKKLKGRAKDRGEEFQSGWNLDVLAQLLEEGAQQKDVNAQTPAEKGKLLNSGFYEIVHCFQRGIGGSFYSFTPRITDGDNVLRTKVNKDPRGEIPITFYYNDQDMSNPLGRSAVEMSGGVQNLIDSEMQMFQFNRALMLNPPIKKWGTYSKSQLKMQPNAIWDLGVSKEADAMPAEIDSTALTQFPANYSLLKSQILNLNQSGDTTSTGASAGNPSFSKTPQGIKDQDARLGISDNHTRKQFEACWQEVMETHINLYFGERSGIQELTLDDETALKLNDLKPGSVSPDNQIRIDYDSETPILNFFVDASSSNMEDDSKQTDAATTLLELVGKFPQFDSNQGGPIVVAELADRLVQASGLEDAERVVKLPKPGEQQEQPPVTVQMVQQIAQQTSKAEIEQNSANDPSNHPVVKIMDILNIKFEMLDPITQKALIQEIFGIVTNAPSPTEQDMALKQQDMQLKTQDQQHQQSIEAANTALKAVQLQNDHKIKASGAAIKVAQTQHDAGMDVAQHGLNVQQNAQQQQQNQVQNNLQQQAQEQSQQPQPAGANQ